ncbi:hypothetical protein [Haladaptatus sp. CMAA 1911]|uniref:hypothetical protein n=1 Tax=unclassified Haladaptatus TaxID=2622732 RepID=UPI0037540406
MQEIESFVQAYDSQKLDATSLHTCARLPAGRQRLRPSTIDAILDQLTTDDGPAARYEGDDGLSGEEGAFVISSFWLVTKL